MEVIVFNKTWNANCHTKWDTDWYDKAYFGPEGVIVDQNGVKLCVVKSPKTFSEPDIYPTKYVGKLKPYCCGELVGETMTYGTYTWRVRMPQCPHMWPALWLCGVHSWPPEIDVVEGYTDNRNGYVKLGLSTRLESNFHMRDDLQLGTHIALGAKGIPTITYLLNHKDIDEYKCEWTKEYVKIYFNGKLVRTMTDKKMLNDLNEHAAMQPIMNIMIDNKFDYNKTKDKAYLEVLDFKYEA